MRNILLISPVYPGPGLPKNTTPVVHYFAKEWVRLGYNVRVVTCPSNFPKFILGIVKLFHTQLESWLNISIRTEELNECEYDLDGVKVMRLPLKKIIPHARYSRKQIEDLTRRIVVWCDNQGFTPDVAVGHWTTPSIEVLPLLKKQYGVPVCMTMHDDGANISAIYKEDYKQLLADIDIIGYRSCAIKRSFENRYGHREKFVYSYSGVPESFINEKQTERTFRDIKNFIFVGMMISRKYPLAILEALNRSTISEEFDLIYIGDGVYVNKIDSVVSKDRLLHNRVHLLGRIDRAEIKKYLSNSDVFVMISKNETFGLVYLEAMAMGCIPIASRNEGFDGIIRDGENGFLCEAGNVDELTEIIDRLRNMSQETLQRMSCNAMHTAREFTDVKVAKRYIEDIADIIK